MIRTILALALMSTQALAAAPRAEPAVEFNPQLWQYELSTDHGGFVAGYNNKFKEIERSGFRVMVLDVCASACTIVLRNPRACATSAALFGFHQVRDALAEKFGGVVYLEKSSKRLFEEYPPAVKAKLGELKPEMVWVKGTDLLPPCK